MAGIYDSKVFDRRYLRHLLLAVGPILVVGLLVVVIWLSIKVWLAVFAGVLLAVFFRTLANWVTKATHLRGGWALTLVLVLLVGLAVLGGWLVAPTRLCVKTSCGERVRPANAPPNLPRR